MNRPNTSSYWLRITVVSSVYLSSVVLHSYLLRAPSFTACHLLSPFSVRGKSHIHNYILTHSLIHSVAHGQANSQPTKGEGINSTPTAAAQLDGVITNELGFTAALRQQQQQHMASYTDILTA